MRRIKYIYQQPSWPDFTWDRELITPLLSRVRHQQGRLKGIMEMLGFALRDEALLRTLTQDVLKSTEIEGEKLDAAQVRSSIARRLGMEIGGLVPSDRNVDGVVEMMLDATQRFHKPLTKQRLFGWHASLFPTGWSGMHKISVGKWRDNENGPMQVVSGALGKEKIHYEAPEADVINKEMKRFLEWFNTADNTDPVLKSGIVHFWFVTIHPFDDGNGRIARVIADMQLAKADSDKQRFYSMSAQIRQERKTYYEMLEKTQRGTTDITLWLEWFLECMSRALNVTDDILNGVLSKTRYWDKHAKTPVNERQRLMLNKLFDGFVGKLTSSKWAKIAKCSADTALRDINDLVEKRMLKKEDGGGRSTSYVLRD